MVTQIQKSPISVCVDAEKWQTYKRGIIGAKCGSELDHCVQAVGLNTEGDKNYWIVRYTLTAIVCKLEPGLAGTRGTQTGVSMDTSMSKRAATAVGLRKIPQ